MRGAPFCMLLITCFPLSHARLSCCCVLLCRVRLSGVHGRLDLSACCTPFCRSRMDERRCHGEEGAGTWRQGERSTRVHPVAHTRAVWRTGDRKRTGGCPASAHMSASTKVSGEIDHCTTTADAAHECTLSLHAVLVCCAACSLLFNRRLRSSSALHAAHGRLCDTSTAASAATVIIRSTDTLPLHPHLVRQRLRPHRLHRCSNGTSIRTATPRTSRVDAPSRIGYELEGLQPRAMHPPGAVLPTAR